MLDELTASAPDGGSADVRQDLRHHQRRRRAARHRARCRRAGFIFAPSTRQVHPDGVRDIVKRLPPDVLTRRRVPQRAARTRHRDRRPCRAARGATPGSEPLSEVRWIRERVRFVIQGFTAGDPALAARPRTSPADVVLVDSPEPGFRQGLRLAAGRRRARRCAPDDRRRPDAGERRRSDPPGAPWGVDVRPASKRGPGRRTRAKLRRSSRWRARRRAPNRATNTPMLGRERRATMLDIVAGVNRPWDWQLDQ